MRKRARDRVIVLSSIFNPSPAPPHELGMGIFLRPQASIFRELASRCRSWCPVEARTHQSTAWEMGQSPVKVMDWDRERRPGRASAREALCQMMKWVMCLLSLRALKYFEIQRFGFLLWEEAGSVVYLRPLLGRLAQPQGSCALRCERCDQLAAAKGHLLLI